jgi:carbon-monoxide dehydrogenase medium subunit
MIPAQFDYVRPTSVADAVTALGSSEDAKVISGGQSLLPLLRLRLAYPDLLVDIGGLSSLRGVRSEGDWLSIGALTTHHELAHSPEVAASCGLLSEAAGTIADPAVRHRGTIGGSLSHSDPAGDLPAVVVALDGVMVAHGPGGVREIPASEFFTGYLSTALAADEILVSVRVPKLGPGWGYRYEKFHPTAQAWAVVGVAAVVRRSNGHVAAARVGLTNMDSVPVRARSVEEAAAGASADAGALTSAASRADAEANPVSDLRASANYRRHLARVLTARALTHAAGLG